MATRTAWREISRIHTQRSDFDVPQLATRGGRRQHDSNHKQDRTCSQRTSFQPEEVADIHGNADAFPCAPRVDTLISRKQHASLEGVCLVEHQRRRADEHSPRGGWLSNAGDAIGAAVLRRRFDKEAGIRFRRLDTQRLWAESVDDAGEPPRSETVVALFCETLDARATPDVVRPRGVPRRASQIDRR